MSEIKYFQGFSKLGRDEKVKRISECLEDPKESILTMEKSRLPDKELQTKFENFSENTIANFHIPYGIAPNFLIDGDLYHIPMAVEESSVVAAASKSAKFWYERGGFQTVSITTRKKGQIHFLWKGSSAEIRQEINRLKPSVIEQNKELTGRMEKRGGGIISIELNDRTDDFPYYYELDFTFETADSMGANFINSVLEKSANVLEENISEPGKLDIIMSILSNYTPESIITMKVECTVEKLNDADKLLTGEQFAEKFYQAIEIAKKNVSRAVTHNKGIMNGIDAVVIATGNDFRAIEAGAQAFASKSGKYTSLSDCNIQNGTFSYSLSIPLALGTVGGLTKLHPLAAKSMEILKNPSARDLMKIVAAAGLANNFGAVRSLITTGIQKGHMKLHLDNILMSFNIDDETRKKAKEYFANRPVSYSEVKSFIDYTE